ncbi:leucyl aminopeptidase [Nocardioides daejeonensis]|uniref:leucyl aminopeptidase n=1 Tax=Nocardioides daejeonensis TaxID=1046556 RepID=UPI000D74DD29|nr:leucyl aminopeptidase [Nocardioides daejeonensis]
MTSYTLRKGSPAKTRSDAVVVGLVKTAKGIVTAPGAEEVGEAWGRKLRPLLESLGFKAGVGEVAKVPSGGVVNAPLVVFLGLGDADALSPAVVRRATGAAVRAVPNAATLALAVPSETLPLLAAAAEGAALGGYAFTRYKKESAPTKPGVGEVIVLSPLARQEEATRAFEEALRVAEAVNTTRDWVNLPPNDLDPAAFVDLVTSQHKATTKGRGAPKIGLEVWDEERLAADGCGGILGVGGGSAAPPRLVKLTWSPKGAERHIALVGKGITYDSGGYTIKPAGSMQTMKSDMAGAAAVVQVLFHIARAGLPVRVTAWAPLAENMVSGTAMRPGDVLTIRGGTTVEVTNTDAEGRLVLADALVLAAEEEPDEIIDVATLTGHMVVALGDKISGVMGDDRLVADLRAAADEAGEAIWPMPIPAEMHDRLRSSKVADIAQHDWVRWGGGLYAAGFLREFTAGLPWAHLDIAGPSFNSGGPHGHVPNGGTGAAVGTLVAYLRTQAATGA